MIRPVAAVLLVLALGGCWEKAPTTLNLSLSTFSYSPVLMTAVEVEGMAPLDTVVVASRAEDPDLPRSLGLYSMNWSAGGKNRVTVRARWVELLTDKAWEAAIDIAPRDLTRPREGTAILTLVFGPHGQLLVASDPISPAEPRRDLAQVCGTRAPSADRDISAEVDAIAQLASTLALDFPPVPDATPCPEPTE